MRTRVHRNAGRTHRGEQSDFGVTQAMARFEQHFAPARLRCLGAHIVAWSQRPRDGDAVASHRAMLHHHHRIGAARQRSAGHDFERLASLNFTHVQFTGAHFADHE